MEGFIIFSDLKGYSKLSEKETEIFFNKVNSELAKRIQKYFDRAEVFNTWGDAVVAVFTEGEDAVDLVLEYRDFFNAYDFESAGMRSLLPRIGGHYGEFFVYKDEVLGRANMYGSNINTAARIEPVTRTGEIYVTREFKDAIENLKKPLTEVKFDELGIVELAKNFGEKELYRLYREGEKAQLIDKIFAMDLSASFPLLPYASSREQEVLDYINRSQDTEILKSAIYGIKTENSSGAFLVQLAGLSKKFGMYREAIECINNLESFFIELNGVQIYPYRFNQEILKLKANCLSRIGEYGEAGDIVYGLWQLGLKDSDTLAMLAAQYKRRALINDEGKENQEEVNFDLLQRAKDLYLEAFRRNIDDYYPAINAAYLYRLLGGIEEENGIKLARYVLDSWAKREGENWWMDSSLAEAELLQDSFSESYQRFERALGLHRPDSFERSAVIEQINIYGKLSGKGPELEKIVFLLRDG